MTRLVLNVFLILTGTSLIGQEIQLKGVVSIHNSKYETGEVQYVPDAYISAPFTKPANSDVQGKFQLAFVGLEPGTSIELQTEKSGLEVVNKYVLQDVVISRKVPLRIFLIDRGKLAQAQTELYNISKKALHKRRDDMIARLRKDNEDTKKAMKELEEYFGHKLEDQYEAEKELIAKIKELEKRLPEFAQTLARQNLDFASDMYIKAYELYKKGDVAGAIKVLDDAALQDSYQSAKNDIAEGEKLKKTGDDLIEKGNEQILQIADSYELKAKSHYLLFQYDQSIEVFEKLVAIYEEHQLSKKKLLPIIDDLALAYQDNEDLDESLMWHQKLIELAEPLLDPNSLEIAQYYNNTALIHSLRDEKEEAFVYQLKAIEIQEKYKDSVDSGLATSYNNISGMYSIEGEFEKALSYQLQAVALKKKEFGEDGIEVALYYANLADAYADLDNYDMAVHYCQKAMDIREENLDASHPDLAVSYGQLSSLYQSFGKYQKALDLMIKAVQIREKMFKQSHPIIADSYNELARAYADAGKFEEALKWQLKDISLSKENFPGDDQKLIQPYYTMGIIFRGKEDIEEAIRYHKMALDMKIRIYGRDDSEIASSLYRLAECYRDKSDYTTTIEYLEQAIKIDLDTYGKSHSYIAEDYLLYSEVSLQMKDYKKARTYRNRADKIISKLDDEIGMKYKSRITAIDEVLNSKN